MIAFWLMPAPGEREFFRSLVEELARRCDAPRFEPHMTLFGGGDISQAVALETLKQLPLTTLVLDIAQIDFSDRYTKTLYVQFRQSAEARALAAAIRTATRSTSDYKFDPHVSLIYKELPNDEKAALAAEIGLPFQRVSFDALRVIAGPAGTTGPADVQAWRPLGERRVSD